MPAAHLSSFVRRFQPSPAATDAELLADFAAARDEQAFAELVARYGPLVLAVCRRVAGDHHLAEDAFQAVFVVLAAKARAVRPGSLAAFLHGVATRTALRARTVADRRRRREAPTATPPEVHAPDAPAEADLVALVDEEIARLPDALRAAVVLCELEGRSRKEAAERLGVPEGTVSSRLAAARKALAGRLRARGVAPAVALAALGGSGAVSAALTARAVAGALAPAGRPAAVQSLATGVLQLMFAQKLKVAVPLVVLTLGALALAALAGDRPDARPAAPPQPKPKPVLAQADEPATKATPKPLPKGPNKLFYWHEGSMVLSDPDGKNAKEFALKGERFHPGGARLSPDGKRLAYLYAPIPPARPVPDPQPQRAEPKLYVRDLDGDGLGTDLGTSCEAFVWSPDGTEIACTRLADVPGKTLEASAVVINAGTKAVTAKLPAGHIVTDWARDGRLLTMTISGTDPSNVKVRLHLLNRDGTAHKALAPDTHAAYGRLSPDGTRVLCTVLTFPKESDEEKKKREAAGLQLPPPDRSLSVLDLATGKFEKVRDVPLNADISEGYCWSPDGKKIAYTWREKHEGKPEDLFEKETESHLIVCDPDGRNQKTVRSVKGKGQWHVTLGGVDWR